MVNSQGHPPLAGKGILRKHPMSPRFLLLLLCLGVPCVPALGDETKARPSVVLTAAQKECLALEPILAVVRLGGDNKGTVPAVVGDAKGEATLTFDIKPAVKARKGAKPLPLEADAAGRRARLFDLLEWYQFPATGEFT